MQVQQNPSIPVSEVYWSLLHKADKKFSKIRELPYYHRNRHEYDAYFYKVFKVYTQLWKFQQENRQKLVDAGLWRSEIGEIASRIAQLYLGQYMRTSEASYLSEAYIFYEAILSREYFKEGMFQDLSLANKKLRFISRFLVVCLLLNRRSLEGGDEEDAWRRVGVVENVGVGEGAGEGDGEAVGGIIKEEEEEAWRW
ncbi:hypothetical protein ACLB2K_073638 [Fragaria x ananassa]